MKKIAKALIAAAALLTPVFLSSCESDPEAAALKRATEIVLSGNTATCSSQDVKIDENCNITISKAGTYALSGTLEDGQIYVDCIDAGNIELILNGVNITNNDGACIVFKKAQLATITLETGTVNTITDGNNYVFEDPMDDEPNAAIFSKEDLVISGGGKLVVNGNYAGAVYSKDGLKIESGELELTAAEHGIKGKDYLVINGGTIDIHAIGDGIKSNNTESDLVGYIEINGGVVNIYSEDEAVQAVSGITINGGELNLQSLNNGIKCVGEISFVGGSVNIDAQDNALDAAGINYGEGCALTIDGKTYNG